MSQIIRLDPAHRQCKDNIINYAYTRDILEDELVIVLSGQQLPCQYILDHSKDLGIFEFSDDSSYYFVRMQDRQSLFLAQLSGEILDKQSVLARFP